MTLAGVITDLEAETYVAAGLPPLVMLGLTVAAIARRHGVEPTGSLVTKPLRQATVLGVPIFDDQPLAAIRWELVPA